MTTIPDGESCAQCRYYVDDVSECRRNPPSVWLATAVYRSASAEHKQRVEVSWPAVKPGDWCGEFGKIKPVAVEQ
jgi:hypothetical protein